MTNPLDVILKNKEGFGESHNKGHMSILIEGFLKVKNDHHSKFSKLSNWKEEA